MLGNAKQRVKRCGGTCDHQRLLKVSRDLLNVLNRRRWHLVLNGRQRLFLCVRLPRRLGLRLSHGNKASLRLLWHLDWCAAGKAEHRVKVWLWPGM
jgi:hypothetical protein